METLFVIDGHIINKEEVGFDVVNDVREIYDLNLSKSIQSFSDMMQFNSTCCVKDDSYVVDIQNLSSEIFLTGKFLYSFKRTSEGFCFDLFVDRTSVFNFSTDENYRLPESEYGIFIEVPKLTNIHCFKDLTTCVISDDLTNRIIKYASCEYLDGSKYTKYYEYIETSRLRVYLLLINDVPYFMSVHSEDNFVNMPVTFDFIYK